MAETLKFAIFKEKIIKTNELLHLHLEKTREVEKLRKCYQQLKLKLEFSKEENKKLMLKNEALSYNLQQNEKELGPLKEEHNKLKQQFNQQEKETGETINNLQINYQLASQELKECKEKLSKLEEQPKPKSPVKRKKRVVEPAAANNVMNQKINQLLTEKEKNIAENGSLKLEIYELKKQITDIHYLEYNSDKIKQTETELAINKKQLNDLKMKLKSSEENKEKELKRLSNELKTINLVKDEIEKENEKLKCDNSLYQIQILRMQGSTEEIHQLKNDNVKWINENKKLKDLINKNQCGDLTPPADFENDAERFINEQIEKIMNDIIPPACLSPLNDFNEDKLVDKHTSSQQQENTHHDKKTPNKKHVASSSGNFTVCNYSDIAKTAVKKREQQKRKRIIKKKSKKVDILEALVALKKANLNFILSSGQFVQLNRVNTHAVNNPYSTYAKSKSIVPEKKYSNTFINKLECTLTCCNNSHMLLKGGDRESSSLLGFFDVKNEVVQQSEHQCDTRNDTVRRSSNRLARKRKKIETNNVKPKETNGLANYIPDGQSVEQEVENILNERVDIGMDVLKENNSESISDVCKTTLKARKSEANSFTCFEKSNKPVVKRSYVTRNLLRSKRLLRSSSHTKTDCDESECVMLPAKKRIAHIPNQIKSDNRNDNVKEDSNSPSSVQQDITNTRCEPISHTPDDSIHPNEPTDQNLDKTAADTPTVKQKSPKTTFKRPVCRTRRSPRLVASQASLEIEEIPERLQEEIKETSPPRCPESPTPDNKGLINSAPKLIPLDPVQEKTEKMPTSKIESLFTKLINYSMEEEVLNEVIGEFSHQNPEYIAQAILEKISKDFHEPPDSKYSPAPLMTVAQRTMLGFMSKLEKSGVAGVFDNYLTLAEHRLLTCQDLQEIAPITRLYLAICKLHNDLHRMRKLCCDVFYFCGDLAVPFLFFVLTSWSEVLPHQVDSKDMPLARVIVQIVYMKQCNKPGYNLMPLRDLLIKFYGYPTERWDSSELLQELFHGYLRNPVRSSDFALLLFCKNHPEKWVHNKIEEHLKPIVGQIPAENFKAAVIILIGNLYNPFSSKSEPNYLPSVRQWLRSLLSETTPDVVKRSVYLCLSRLKKK